MEAGAIVTVKKGLDNNEGQEQFEGQTGLVTRVSPPMFEGDETTVVVTFTFHKELCPNAGTGFFAAAELETV
jgi:hypothetical protein